MGDKGIADVGNRSLSVRTGVSVEQVRKEEQVVNNDQEQNSSIPLFQREHVHVPGPWEYKVGPEIAEGSFGRVLFGIHKNTERNVAIKVIDRFSCQKEPHLLAAVRREQMILCQLRECRNVVRLLSSFVDSHCIYMVLECCMGGTLQDVIQRRLQDIDDQNGHHAWSMCLAKFTSQILNGLCSLHLCGYIHADLKPSNVLITENGRDVRLADFGSALSIDHLCEGTERLTSCMATCDYAAPELLRGTLSDPDHTENCQTMTIIQMIAMDAWSLGVLLWSAWQGQSPFHSPSDALAVGSIQEYTLLPSSEEQNQWLMAKETVRMPNHWRTMTHELLHPIPLQRFRNLAQDLESKEALNCALAKDKLIRNLHRRLGSYQQAMNNLQWECLAPSGQFDIGYPDWWRKQRMESSRMSDGAEGWAVFLT